MSVLINVDVPDLTKGMAFYSQAFGLTVNRRLGETVAEMSGWPVALYLLQKPSGSVGAARNRRNYARHWTPVHLDVVVDDIDVALARALNAGAVLERDVRQEVWGKIALVADPFGNGLCLVQFLNRGYDEIADPSDGHGEDRLAAGG